MIKYFVVFLTWLCFSHVHSRPSDFITRDVRVELPGSERINKRSPQDYSEVSADLTSDDDYIKEEYDDLSNEYYSSEKDSYDSRKIRSISSDNDLENADSDDMEVAENGLVFLPLFRSKNNYELKQRLRRSVDITKQTNDKPKNGNEMMFLPILYPVDDLKRNALALVQTSNVHQEKQRTRREDTNKILRHVETKDDLQMPNNQNKFQRRSRRSDDVDLDTAENGLIFRPLFRSRQ